MKSSVITASDCNCSLTKAYLYFIYTIYDGIGYLYIGETSEKRGAMGRLAYHLQYDNKELDEYSEGATFVKNMIESPHTFFSDSSLIRDITMICYDLSCFSDFTGKLHKQNRMAIEYLVKTKMSCLSVDKTLAIPYRIVSEAENNSFTRLAQYQQWSQKICLDVMSKLPFRNG